MVLKKTQANWVFFTCSTSWIHSEHYIDWIMALRDIQFVPVLKRYLLKQVDILEVMPAWG